MNQNKALETLIANSDLIGINNSELYAKSYEEEIPSEYKTDFEFVPQQMLIKGFFGVRLQVTATMPFGEARVVTSATYKLSEGYTPTVETIEEFMHEVGIYVLAPVVRATLHDVSSRVFPNPVVMPMIDRNSFPADTNFKNANIPDIPDSSSPPSPPFLTSP